MIKVFYDKISEEMISTFTEIDGFYTFKSWQDLINSCSSDYEQYELIELTSELYNKMYNDGIFKGHESD